MDIDFKKFTSPSNSLSKGEGEHESPVTAFLLH
jgi:hypothetical protein